MDSQHKWGQMSPVVYKIPPINLDSLWGAGYKAEGTGAGIGMIPSLEEVPIADR